MLTLFSVPKPFTGHTGVIQHNALRSWGELWRDCDVILLGGDGEGQASVAAAAWQNDMRHIPDLAYDSYGTPLVSSVFETGERHASTDLVCYINADIILLSDFLPAVERASSSGRPFLLVGQRTDIDVTAPLDFGAGWEARLRADLAQRGTLHQDAGIDYFVYRKGTMGAIPPFALGRWRWDNWLVWNALRRGLAVIDGTACITAVHQNHDYAHIESDEIKRAQLAYNDALVAQTGGQLCRISDATHAMTAEGIRKKRGELR